MRKLVFGPGGTAAESVDAANTGLPQSFDGAIGVLGTVADVRPVETRGDACVDSAQGDDEISDLGILGPEDIAGGTRDVTLIIAEASVGKNTSKPHMFFIEHAFEFVRMLRYVNFLEAAHFCSHQALMRERLNYRVCRCSFNTGEPCDW